MEAINNNNEVNTREETAPEIPAATEEDYVQTSIEEAATPSASTADERTKKTDQQQSNQPKEKLNFEGNLLYAENLGFIPGAMYGGNLFCKFRKDYKEFDYTNEDILVYLEQNNPLQYLTLLQISKPNKSIDIVSNRRCGRFSRQQAYRGKGEAAAICQEGKKNFESHGKGCTSRNVKRVISVRTFWLH